MRTPDRWVAAILLLLGLIAVFHSSRLRIGELGQPGPGFFPFCLSVALCLLSLGLWWRSRPSGSSAPAAPPVTSPGSYNKIIWSVAAIAGYAFALEPLGFALVTFLFLLFLNRVVQPRPWRIAIGGSLIATILSYTLFRLLQVQLPTGAWMR